MAEKNWSIYFKRSR